MPSNRTPTRFYGPDFVTSTPSTLYTVGASKIAVIRMVAVYAGVADRLVLAVNALAGTDDIFYFYNLVGDQNRVDWLYIPLVAGNTIVGSTDDGDTNLGVTITGDLYDA